MTGGREAVAAGPTQEPYSFYDSTADPDDLRELLGPRGAAGLLGGARRADELVGLFFAFRPKEERGRDRPRPAPRLTGRGLGASLLAAGLEFAQARFAPERFTLAVATFNERAVTVSSGGLCPRARCVPTNGAEWEFLEMI